MNNNNNNTIEIPCPLCAVGIVTGIVTAQNGMTIWRASCNNGRCNGYEETEIMSDRPEFPTEEWGLGYDSF